MGAFVQTRNTEKDAIFFFFTSLRCSLVAVFLHFPEMLAAEAGSFVFTILIKPLVRQLSETKAERGVNLPGQQWDVRGEMSDRAGI